jgi:FkbM family methyltransferase
MNSVRPFKIRLSKWISRKMPDRWVYWFLRSRSTIPDQKIFQAGFQAADPSKTALDIGANRGIVSYYMSKRFANIHSFEPNAELGGFLKKVLPSNCTLHTCALSNETADNELSVILEAGVPIHGRGRILNAAESASPPSGAEPQSYSVQKIHLETLDSQNLKNIGFIKIDVEGHEEKVIRGGLSTLRENRPVLIVEIEKRHAGKPAKETIDLIESLGYDGYFFEGGTRRPVSEYRESMQDPGYPYYINDFLFLPKTPA